MAGATVSALGDAVTLFAVGWVASGIGSHTLGVVLSVEGVPAFVLLLVGGVVADRIGIRRTMLLCDATMLVVMAAAAVVASRRSLGTADLVVLALVTGGVTAAYRPAAGVFPRLFARGDALPRMLAVSGACLQAAQVAGPVLAGFLLAAGGFGLAASVDAATFGVVLVVLGFLRPPEPDRAREQPGGDLRATAREAWRTPAARALLVATGAVAVAVISCVSLGVPLLGRAHGWSAARTGVVAAGWLVGLLVVTVTVAVRGAPPVRVMALGPVVGAAGVGVLAVASSGTVALLGTTVMGAGTGLFTTRALPAFLELSTPEALARFQSLLGAVQSGPLLLATPLLGAAAGLLGARTTVLVLAGVLLTAVLPLRAVVSAG